MARGDPAASGDLARPCAGGRRVSAPGRIRSGAGVQGMSFLAAADIANAVASRKRSAGEVVAAALARIERENKRLNAFTAVTAERARTKAAAIDAAIAAGK